MSCFVKDRAVPQDMSSGPFSLVAEETEVGVNLLGFEGSDCVPEMVRKAVPDQCCFGVLLADVLVVNIVMG